jgi:hypothetical protein
MPPRPRVLLPPRRRAGRKLPDLTSGAADVTFRRPSAPRCRNPLTAAISIGRPTFSARRGDRRDWGGSSEGFCRSTALIQQQPQGPCCGASPLQGCGLLRGVYVRVTTLRTAGCFQTKFYSFPESDRDEISLRRVTERLCVDIRRPASKNDLGLRQPAADTANSVAHMG